MLHAPVALITEKLRGQSLDDDHIKVPREGALQIEGKNVWVSCEGDTKDQEGNSTSRGDKPTGSASSLPFLPPLNDNERLVLGAPRSSPQRSFSPATNTHRYPIKPIARFRGNHGDHGPRVDYSMRAFETPPKKKHCRSLSVPADTPPQGSGMASTSPLVEGARVWRPIPVTALTSGGGGLNPQSDARHVMPAHFSSPHHTVSSFTAIDSTTARLHRDFKVVGMGGGGNVIPMAPSPLSIDSGRDTTSDPHTPPQSPIPRPSSATSVRSSHSAAVNSSWWTHSPGRLRGEALQSRSLSCEEHMTSGLQQATCSTPSGMGSTPSSMSPCRSKIPRCHSQPCVLHDRRCGKKRRRDDRPMLDFHKMTERGRWRPDVDFMRVGGLMPIASSPRDSDLPATPRLSDHAALGTIADLDMAACADLPTTPPASDVSSGIDIREPVKLIGEEEEEEEEELEDQNEDSNCGCNRDSRRDESGLFPLIDLDLEQIENH